MGDLVRRTLQEKPHLRRVVQHERHKLLKFSFTFEGSVPSALREENPRLYSFLFEPREKGDWISALLKAYDSRLAPGKGQKRVRLALRFCLNQLLRNALDILVNDAIGKGKQYDGNIKEEVAILKACLERKPGPHKSKRRQQDAIRYAKRHAELLPEAKKLKAFVKSRNEHDEKVLGQDAEKELQFQWLHYATQGEALRHLPTVNKDRASRTATLNGKWAPWQLSVGVIWCEEKSKRSPNTIYYKYIPRGKRLLKKASPANKQAS